MDPNQLFLDPKRPFSKAKDGSLTDYGWRFLKDLQLGLTTVDLTSQVTGILPSANGGTGINNHGRTLTIAGASLTLTQTGATNVTLPTNGTIVATNSPLTAIELTVSTGVTPDSGGIKHIRTTTGSIAGGASALVTVSWATAFADANYTVVASVLDSTASASSLSIVHIETVAAGSVKIRVQNTSGGNLTGTLQVMALHD
jgi:hypothetical protein